MEEAKQAWASLKSVGKFGLSLNGNSSSDTSTTIWYDMPAPVIIHCHEFRSPTENDDTDDTDDTDDKGKVERFAIASPRDGEERSNGRIDDQDEGKAVHSVQRDRTEKTLGKRERHTVQLTAVTSLETDSGGVPKISFSFLCASTPDPTDAGETVATTAASECDGVVFSRDDLYDVPRNSCVFDEIEREKVVESECETEPDGNASRGTISAKFIAESVQVGEKIDGHVDDDEVGEEIATEKASRRSTTATTAMTAMTGSVEKTGSCDSMRRSGRSFEYGKGRRSRELNASYSDPECSSAARSNASRRNVPPSKVFVRCRLGSIGADLARKVASKLRIGRSVLDF